MSSMRVREESRLMLDWSILSLLSLLLSSPSFFSSPPSCLAAASAKLNPLVGSVLYTKTDEIRKIGKKDNTLTSPPSLEQMTFLAWSHQSAGWTTTCTAHLC